MGTHEAIIRRAFTLLEVLLAIAILASMSLLIASLWGQSAAWGEDNTAEHQRMRLQRVLALARDQWSTRTASIQMDDFGRSVETAWDRVTFTTTTPVIHPDVALVEVTYAVERDLSSAGVGPLGAWKLVYTETRLADPSVRADDQESRDATTGSLDLLTGCAELRFERFGPERPPALGAREEAEAVEGDAEDGEESEEAVDTTPRWRAYEARDRGLIPAVRLVGEREGERFACLFVIEHSR